MLGKTIIRKTKVFPKFPRTPLNVLGTVCIIISMNFNEIVFIY